MTAVLVVDVCGTLVRDNTTHEFLRRAPLGILRRFRVKLLLSRPGLALTRIITTSRYRRLLIRSLAGSPRASLIEAARRYAQFALRSNVRRSVLDRIASARANGMRVLLASASIDVVVESFAELLGADGFVATKLEYRAGVATGRIAHDTTGRKLADLRAGGLIGDAEIEVITDDADDSDLLSSATRATLLTAEHEA